MSRRAPCRRQASAIDVEARDDFSRFEEHGRHHDARRAGVERRGQTLGQRAGRPRRHLHDLQSVLRQPIDLAPDGVELAVGRHDPRTFQERQGRQPARDELMRVLAECDIVRLIAEQPGETGLHLRRLSCRPRPLVVNELGRIEPRTLLRFEADVRPRLVGMSRQQQAFGHAEARVVRARAFRDHADTLSQPSANLPQIGKQIVPQRGLEVGGAARPARARPAADGPLHHPDVVIAPLRETLVEIHEPLADLGVLHVATVDVEEDLLNLGRGLQRPGVVARQLRRRYRVTLT